jgi:hypothetical protein
MKKEETPEEKAKKDKYLQAMHAWDQRDQGGKSEAKGDGFQRSWSNAVEKFRARHYTYRPRKFVFPEEKSVMSWFLFRLRSVFTGIPAVSSLALASLLLGIIFFTGNPGVKNTGAGREEIAKASGSAFPVMGTALLASEKNVSLGKNRILKIQKGALMTVEATEAEFPVIDLYGSVAKAEFDLKGKTFLTVRNDFIRVKVTGTAFGIDWAGGNGRVALHRGSVTVVHRNGEIIRMRAGQSLTYSKGGLRLASVSPPQKNPPERFILNLKSGEILKGVILRENERDIVLQSDERGKLIIERTEITDRIRESALVKSKPPVTEEKKPEPKGNDHEE